MSEKHDAIEKRLKDVDEKIALLKRQEISTIKKLENICNEKLETFENTQKESMQI
jgi:hypothetical protein